MRVVISDSDNQVLSDSESISNKDLLYDLYRKISYSSDETFWKSEAQEIKYTGTHIATHKVNVLKDITLRTFDAPDVISLFFVENGFIQVETGHGKMWNIGTLQHNLIYNAYSTAATIFRQQQDLRLTIVSFTPEYFMQLTEGGGRIMDKVASCITTGQSFALGSTPNLKLNIQMLQLLRGFEEKGYNAAAERLLTESKVLQLLAAQIEQLDKETFTAGISKLSSADIKCLNDVRDILHADLSRNHTLDGLSREAGINVFKLKQGFKVLFGQPVFKYLKEQRLDYAARQIVLDTKSLSQIAEEAGFASPSHFSEAFKQRYGIPPNKLR